MISWVSWAIVGTLMSGTAAWAGSQLEDSKSSCSGINCGAMTIRGVHQRDEPFVIQVLAAEGECLRLDVDEQSEDMAMLVIAPSVNYGISSDDRDFDGGDYRPLVNAEVPWSGWYTVVVSYYALDHLTAKFTLKYGRYPAGNANCQAPVAVNGRQFERLGPDLGKVSAPAASAH
jgi:hypothetical protein